MSLMSPTDEFRHRLRGAGWKVLVDGPAPGAANMARDLELLDAAVREECGPTLRFYTWDPPAVSLGHFQTTDGVDLEYAARRGWDVVRRPTGGRAVLHQHELTYGIVLPPSVVGGTGVRTSYSVLVGALNAGLASLLGNSREGALSVKPWALGSDARAVETAPNAEGLPLRPNAQRPTPTPPNCFALASECDSLVRERKLVGSAQVRRGGALLQHGSILLDAEPEAWAALFGTPGRLVTLRELLGFVPEVEAVIEAVTSGFSGLGWLEPGEPVHPPAG
jgi:lipoate-protein ligase A